LKPYPQLLREKGYYTTNNAKTDYNVEVDLKTLWDQCDGQAHYKNRQPGQPFFAVFNFEISHESQIRNENTLEESRRHDPAEVRVPDYHPDTPEVRKDWAQYYDRITQLDEQIQLRLDELNESGLADDTIVFFYGDNGCGMPRGKRTVLHTGQSVPLVIHFPDKYKHLAPKEYSPSGVSLRLVSFIDFAPTLLSLIGEETPETMHGKAFAGKYDSGPQPYTYGFRGRMDERCDESRSVRDERYVLALNLYPQIPYSAHVAYMYQTPTTRVWKKLYGEGKLPHQQAFFFQMKPPVELYDLKTDPDQVHNLAYQSEHVMIRNRLWDALNRQMKETCDLGFLPETMIWERTQDSTPYELGHDPKRYDFDMLADAWGRNVGDESAATAPWAVFQKDMKSTDDAVRYWVGVGLLYRLAKTAGPDGTKPTADTKRLLENLRPDLKRLAGDANRIVRIPAAEALGRFGTEEDAATAANILLGMIEENPADYYHALCALNSLDDFARRVVGSEFRKRVEAVSKSVKPLPPRASECFGNIIQHILEQ